MESMSDVTGVSGAAPAWNGAIAVSSEIERTAATIV
jgi:hypothetical protein